MEWIAYCTVCGEISRGPNGQWEESEARVHRTKTGHTTIVGYEPPLMAEMDVEELRRRQARERAEEVLERVSQPLDVEQRRPLPETYGDWVDLADDIKRADSESIYTVNEKLTTIMHNIGDVDGAKRWLTDKAGELGIT